MLISAITAQKRNKERVNIFIDGKFAFSLPLELCIKHHLKKDQEITEDFIQELIKENEYKIWFDKSLNFLSFRSRSVKEVADYLKKHEVGDRAIELILEKLIRLKFLDDEKFIAWFVEQRNTFKPKGEKLLKIELLQKGISRELINDFFAKNQVDDKTKKAQIEAIIQKKITSLKRLDPTKKRQKIQRLLFSRGFDWDEITGFLKQFSID